MTSNYMIINYLNCLQKAATPLTVSSGRQRQAAANFDVTPYPDCWAEEKHISIAISLEWAPVKHIHPTTHSPLHLSTTIDL